MRKVGSQMQCVFATGNIASLRGLWGFVTEIIYLFILYSARAKWVLVFFFPCVMRPARAKRVQVFFFFFFLCVLWGQHKQSECFFFSARAKRVVFFFFFHVLFCFICVMRPARAKRVFFFFFQHERSECWFFFFFSVFINSFPWV